MFPFNRINLSLFFVQVIHGVWNFAYCQISLNKIFGNNCDIEVNVNDAVFDMVSQDQNYPI